MAKGRLFATEDGLQQLNFALDRLAGRVPEQARTASGKIAVQMHSVAVRRCPVDTGFLRASLNWDVDRAGDSIEISVGTAVEYAPAVEFGVPSRNIPEKPYLRPAVASVEEYAKQVWSQAVNSAIAEEGDGQ